jgi:hypothetical protein
VVGIATVGCARIPALRGGMAEANVSTTTSTEPEDTTPELSFVSDAKWKAFASGQPLTNAARSDVQINWARPNYGTSSWKPALVATVASEDTGSLSGAQWIWYPQDGFTFGGVNRLPDNRRVVHFRRVFYSNVLQADANDAFVSVMPSGKITIRVFLNGYELKTDAEEMYGGTAMDRQERSRNRMRQQMLGEYEMMDRQERKYALRDHLVVGKNVLAIEATAHINNDVGGKPVPNYVRSGIAVKAQIR